MNKKELLHKEFDILRYLFIGGVWVCIACLIVVGVYVSDHLTALQQDPCGLCEEKQGMQCNQMPIYVTDQKDDKLEMAYKAIGGNNENP